MIDQTEMLQLVSGRSSQATPTLLTSINPVVSITS
jgi:hypothetical protein